MQLILGLNYPTHFYFDYGFKTSGYCLPLPTGKTILETCIDYYKDKITNYYFILYETDNINNFINKSYLETLNYKVIYTKYNDKGLFDISQIQKDRPFIYQDPFVFYHYLDFVKDKDMYMLSKSLKSIPYSYCKNSDCYLKFLNDEPVQVGDMICETVTWLAKPIDLFEYISDQITFEIIIEEKLLHINDTCSILIKNNNNKAFQLTDKNICIITEGSCATLEENYLLLDNNYILIGAGLFQSISSSSYYIIHDASIQDTKEYCAIMQKYYQSNLIGPHKPSLYNTNQYHLYLLKYQTDEQHFYYTKDYKQVIYIVAGTIQINNNIYNKYSLITIDKYTVTCLTSITDSEIILCKVPYTKDWNGEVIKI
jgi:hypothetical protein